MKFDVVLPILGFEKIKSYELEKIDELFFSLENKEEKVSFTLVNPFVLRKYEFDMDLEIKKELEIDDTKSSIMVLNPMIIKTPIENSTINFAAPLVFNFDNGKMAQIVLDAYEYKLAEKLSEFIKD